MAAAVACRELFATLSVRSRRPAQADAEATIATAAAAAAAAGLVVLRRVLLWRDFFNAENASFTSSTSDPGGQHRRTQRDGAAAALHATLLFYELASLPQGAAQRLQLGAMQAAPACADVAGVLTLCSAAGRVMRLRRMWEGLDDSGLRECVSAREHSLLQAMAGAPRPRARPGTCGDGWTPRSRRPGAARPRPSRPRSSRARASSGSGRLTRYCAIVCHDRARARRRPPRPGARVRRGRAAPAPVRRHQALREGRGLVRDGPLGDAGRPCGRQQHRPGAFAIAVHRQPLVSPRLGELLAF